MKPDVQGKIKLRDDEDMFGVCSLNSSMKSNQKSWFVWLLYRAAYIHTVQLQEMCIQISRLGAIFSTFQYSEMNEELQTEVVELCVTACEKYSSNNEVSCTECVHAHRPNRYAIVWRSCLISCSWVNLKKDADYVISIWVGWINQIWIQSASSLC